MAALSADLSFALVVSFLTIAGGSAFGILTGVGAQAGIVSMVAGGVAAWIFGGAISEGERAFWPNGWSHARRQRQRRRDQFLERFLRQGWEPVHTQDRLHPQRHHPSVIDLARDQLGLAVHETEVSPEDLAPPMRSS